MALDLRTKLQKKAEAKLQKLGNKLGTKVRKIAKSYSPAMDKADEEYAKSPKGKRAKKLYDAGGSY